MSEVEIRTYSRMEKGRGIMLLLLPFFTTNELLGLGVYSHLEELLIPDHLGNERPNVRWRVASLGNESFYSNVVVLIVNFILEVDLLHLHGKILSSRLIKS
jgi:hypothetical protein